jgi:hypothetical protein
MAYDAAQIQSDLDDQEYLWNRAMAWTLRYGWLSGKQNREWSETRA